MAWKPPQYRARKGGCPYSVANRTASTTVAIASQNRLNSTTFRTSRRTSIIRSVLVSAWTASRARRPTRPEMSTANRVAIVMMPSPPTCISPARTTCPYVDQCVPVSTATSPVTHTAEVEVNSASRNRGESPDSVDAGSMSRPVPIMIASRKPLTTTCAGCWKRAREVLVIRARTDPMDGLFTTPLRHPQEPGSTAGPASALFSAGPPHGCKRTTARPAAIMGDTGFGRCPEIPLA
jgi:hypothetical protein